MRIILETCRAFWNSRKWMFSVSLFLMAAFRSASRPSITLSPWFRPATVRTMPQWVHIMSCRILRRFFQKGALAKLMNCFLPLGGTVSLFFKSPLFWMSSTARSAKTTLSSRELEASRFAPWTPVAATSPQAYRPLISVRDQVSTSTPPHM